MLRATDISLFRRRYFAYAAITSLSFDAAFDDFR